MDNLAVFVDENRDGNALNVKRLECQTIRVQQYWEVHMVIVGPELSILGRILRNREHCQARRLVPACELLCENAVHSVVKRLRKKLDAQCGLRGLIENHHGRGFMLHEQGLLDVLPS